MGLKESTELEGEEAVKHIEKFLEKSKKCPVCHRYKVDLAITDVPKETLDGFREFANGDKFKSARNKGGHYGFALKFLLDFYLSCNKVNVDELNEKINYALEKIAEMSSADKGDKEENVITTVGGKKIRRK